MEGMRLNIQTNVCGANTVPELGLGETLQLEHDNNSSTWMVNPQGCNIVEPAWLGVCSPLGRYPQSVFPFWVLYPPLS